MADVPDTRVEDILRSAMRAETRDIPVTITPTLILAQRQARQGRRTAARRGLLLLAATFLVGTAVFGWVSSRPIPEPTAGRPRLLVIGGLDAAHRYDTSTGLGISLLSVDGATESVARVPATSFPEGLETTIWTPRWPARDTIGIYATDSQMGEFLVSIDLDAPDTRVTVAPAPSPQPTRPIVTGTAPVPCGPDGFRLCLSGIQAGIESGPAADGSYRAWAPLRADGSRVASAIWASDGGIWFISSGIADGARSARLTHVAPSGETTTSPPFGIPLGSIPSLDSSSPDDSLVSVWLSDSDQEAAVIEPATGRGARVPGFPAGWVDAERAGRLRHDGVTLDPGVPLGTSTPIHRTLESFETQVAPLSIARIALRHEEPASADPPTFETGDVEVAQRHGISLECAGAGQVHILTQTGLATTSDLDCDAYSGGALRGDPAVQSTSVSMTIRADPGIAWRLIIFDQGSRL